MLLLACLLLTVALDLKRMVLAPLESVCRFLGLFVFEPLVKRQPSTRVTRAAALASACLLLLFNSSADLAIQHVWTSALRVRGVWLTVWRSLPPSLMCCILSLFFSFSLPPHFFSSLFGCWLFCFASPSRLLSSRMDSCQQPACEWVLLLVTRAESAMVVST